MEFADAAAYFDTEQLYDGYTGDPLFLCQVRTFNENTSDGATTRRRTMSHSPDFTLPDRRVVLLHGERWLCSATILDGFGNELTRKNYSMRRCDATMAILTPAQACAAAAGTTAYMQKLYFKDDINALTNSEIDTFWNIFTAPGEPVSKGTVLRDQNGTLYRVRGTYVPAEGTRICQCDQLDDDAVVTVAFDTGTFDPITETRTAGTTSVTAIRLELPKFFSFRYATEQSIQAGDFSLLIPTTYTPKTGDTFTMDSVKWRVMTYQSERDAWALHVRRV